jgi:hypothetical protein
MLSNTNDALLSRELVRFFQVSRSTDQICQMFSPYVDSYWHAVEARNPRSFQSFCEREIGCEIEHRELIGEGVINWVSEYERRFGKLSQVWFMNAEGLVDQSMIDRYDSGHGIYACWDCHPMPKPSDLVREKKTPPGEESTRPKESELPKGSN